MGALTISSLAESLGVEVAGVDLSSPLSAQDRHVLEEVWRTRLVLVFRDQVIDDAAQIRFSRSFGDLEIYPLGDNRSSGHPEIFRVSNCDEQGELLPADDPDSLWNNLTEYWHTDSSYRRGPAAGAVLNGIEVPGQGGDTSFVNLKAAYEALPSHRKSELDGMVAVHDWTHGYNYASDLMKSMKPEEVEAVPPVRHRLIRVDPKTGERSLFISPGYVAAIDGMSDDNARGLIEELTEWAIQPRFVYKHRWQRRDVLMWNNPPTMHARDAFDYASQKRIMHRTTIVGDARASGELV